MQQQPMTALIEEVINKQSWMHISDEDVDAIKRTVLEACGLPQKKISGQMLKDGLLFYETDPKSYCCAVGFMDNKLEFIKIYPTAALVSFSNKASMFDVSLAFDYWVVNTSCAL